MRWVWLLRAGLLLVGLLPWVWWVLPEEVQKGMWLSLSTFCHQRTARSLVWMGVQMPVCSRCAGVFAGLGLGAMVFPPAGLVARWRTWLLGAAAVMIIEVGIQDLVRHSPFHPTRLLTGLALGWILTGGVVHLLSRSGRVA